MAEYDATRPGEDPNTANSALDLGSERRRKEVEMQQRAAAAESLRQSSLSAVGDWDAAVASGRANLAGGEQNIRAQAAKSLAAGLSRAPVGSGASLAAGRQAGMDAGNALAGFKAGQADFDIRAQQGRYAAQEAAQTMMGQYEEMRAANDATLTRERQTTMDDYETTFRGIVDGENSKWNADERSMYNQICALADREEDPYLRQWIRRRAEEIYERENWG